MVEGYIYKLTLIKDTEAFKTGECYIGKHNGTKPYYTGSGKIIKRLLSKYGNNIFDRKILAKDLNTNELLCYLEIYYITYYKCNRSITGLGLNLTEGGEGIFGYKWTEKRKKEFSIKLKEAYKLGKKKVLINRKEIHQYDLYTRDYITTFESGAMAARSVGAKESAGISGAARGVNSYANGYIWSYKKVSKIDKISSKSKPVLQYDLKGKFLKKWFSPVIINKELGFSISAIHNCCNDIANTSYNFIWRWENIKIKIPILMFDLNNKFIKQFKSINAASKETGITHRKIVLQCKGNKINNKYIFKYGKT